VATYRLYTNCEHCNQRHPLPFGFSTDRLIPEEGSIIDIFKDRRPPKSIISIIKNRTKCPITGNELHQPDPNKIFITPTENNKST
jgi:hypothetical protein